MENTTNDCKDTKKKSRPTQRLYVPPAQRNKSKTTKGSLQQINTNIVKESYSSNNMETIQSKISVESEINCSSSDICQTKSDISDINTGMAEEELKKRDSTNKDEQSLLIVLNNNIKIDDSSKCVDVDKEEMERAIVNINRKSRPLIKHVNVGNTDVLHIDIHDKDVKVKKHMSKPKKVDAIVDEQVANWEDLFNEADEINGEITEQIRDYIGESDTHEGKCIESVEEDDDECPKKNTGPNALDHVIELYDFPSTFKTQDLMQLYSEVNNDLMYVKWCDDTHALLVLSTPNQAKRALNIQHGIIKSRNMTNASNVAGEVASRVDLKPAMKRPQTNMQTARRLITTHLGTKSKVSKEEYAKEREELRKAKELKKALKESENDAWDGNPRPSTA